MSRYTDGEYFVQEDSGKNLARELINFKIRVHKLLSPNLREQLFSELDIAVDIALTGALNFELLENYNKMNGLYAQFARETDEERNNEIKSNLDTLWSRVAQYRSSKQYMEMMHACASFRELAPYNAMLIQMQRPSARYVLTEKQWYDKYKRRIKPNARPMIILVQFGPVDFVFDISDTYADSLFKETDESILDRIAEPYKTKKPVAKKVLDTLIGNLAFYGIELDRNFISGPSYAAQIARRNDLQSIEIRVNKKSTLVLKASYLLSVRNGAGDGECFASICHELAHLFCHHISMPSKWTEKRWDARHIGNKLEEFEAESTSWLICERLGIGNPSEEYLTNFTDKKEEVAPNVSIERILAATSEIERMLKPMNCRNGMLFKHDKSFRQIVTEIKKNGDG